MSAAPKFPPLLKGHRVPIGRNPAKLALSMLKKGKIGAGDILWSEDRSRLNFSLVLEPEVERERCPEMLYLVMVAFGDALGAISAPETAINYKWPNTILLNEANLGVADFLISEIDLDDHPAWMLLSLDVAIHPDRSEKDPGHHKERTTIWDEGCGQISRTELLESVARHIVNWIHTWSEDGFKPIHDQWMGRIFEKSKIESSLTDAGFIGMDELGNALVKNGDNLEIVKTLNAIEALKQET